MDPGRSLLAGPPEDGVNRLTSLPQDVLVFIFSCCGGDDLQRGALMDKTARAAITAASSDEALWKQACRARWQTKAVDPMVVWKDEMLHFPRWRQRYRWCEVDGQRQIPLRTDLENVLEWRARIGQDETMATFPYSVTFQHRERTIGGFVFRKDGRLTNRIFRDQPAWRIQIHDEGGSGGARGGASSYSFRGGFSLLKKRRSVGNWRVRSRSEPLAQTATVEVDGYPPFRVARRKDWGWELYMNLQKQDIKLRSLTHAPQQEAAPAAAAAAAAPPAEAQA